MTDYRLQDETMPIVVVDLQRPRSGNWDPAAAYVAISRVSKLSGLATLQPFNFDSIHQDSGTMMTVEEDRLAELEGETQSWLEAVR